MSDLPFDPRTMFVLQWFDSLDDALFPRAFVRGIRRAIYGSASSPGSLRGSHLRWQTVESLAAKLRGLRTDASLLRWMHGAASMKDWISLWWYCTQVRNLVSEEPVAFSELRRRLGKRPTKLKLLRAVLGIASTLNRN